MRAYVALIILLIATCALVAGLMAKPIGEPLAIDAQSPGVWPNYAATRDAQMNAWPQMLVAPCPLTPQNLPIRQPERNA